jgi:hypothetical protein
MKNIPCNKFCTVVGWRWRTNSIRNAHITPEQFWDDVKPQSIFLVKCLVRYWNGVFLHRFLLRLWTNVLQIWRCRPKPFCCFQLSNHLTVIHFTWFLQKHSLVLFVTFWVSFHHIVFSQVYAVILLPMQHTFFYPKYRTFSVWESRYFYQHCTNL